MTTAATTHPLSASVFLFGDNNDSVKALAKALGDNGVVGSVGAALTNLSRAGLGALGGQMATVAHGLLDLDLGDLLVEGWRKFGDLTEAAKRTAAAPGSSELLDLATHSITSTHSPRVEVFVNDVQVAVVQFDLSVKFAAKGVVATVRDGNLVSLHSGVCDVEGQLSAKGRQLAKREAHFELPLLLRLGEGLPLLLAARPDAADSPSARDPEG